LGAGWCPFSQHSEVKCGSQRARTRTPRAMGVARSSAARECASPEIREDARRISSQYSCHVTVCMYAPRAIGFRRDGERRLPLPFAWGTTVAVAGVTLKRLHRGHVYNVRTAVKARLSVHAGEWRRSPDILASRSRVSSSTRAIAQHHRARSQFDTATTALEGAHGCRSPHERGRRHPPRFHRRYSSGTHASTLRSNFTGRGTGSSGRRHRGRCRLHRLCCLGTRSQRRDCTSWLERFGACRVP
jgi:hypothetical protein